jgi:16S rRNA A1518/A1519 N6-dimethyltransferase RsmA/KsgA/DIM1 with predicted DNA glycosylase/AP lyase activity
VRTPYGQNFLVSVPAAQHIAEALHSSTGDRVIEIGPGRGALTVHVLPLCHHLTVVELDRTLADLLIRRWGHEPKLSVVSDDFMNWPLPSGTRGNSRSLAICLILPRPPLCKRFWRGRDGTGRFLWFKRKWRCA